MAGEGVHVGTSCVSPVRAAAPQDTPVEGDHETAMPALVGPDLEQPRFRDAIEAPVQFEPGRPA